MQGPADSLRTVEDCHSRDLPAKPSAMRAIGGLPSGLRTAVSTVVGYP